ncbi:MAG TPA: hypothetical protein VHM23_17925 [Actinomycetota bacterium]|jgi:hypothetical protein|nr:hypothetical protein [Actinomycetota bacterium]
MAMVLQAYRFALDPTPTKPELRREWNRAKQQVAPWWMENSKEA